MDNFVMIPRDLGGIESKNKFLDLAVYFTISRFRCGNSSKISYNKIVEYLGISKTDAVKAVKDLKENGFIKYDSIPIYDVYYYNEYYFSKTSNFEMISPDLLKKGLKAKQIGLLIYLKLNSISGWYYYKDYSDLARKLGCTRQTASKLIKELGEYFKVSKSGGIQFTNKIFTFKKEIEEIDIIIPTISMDGTPDKAYEEQINRNYIKNTIEL